MICKQKLKLKKKNGFLEVRSENKLKWLGEWGLERRGGAGGTSGSVFFWMT